MVLERAELFSRELDAVFVTVSLHASLHVHTPTNQSIKLSPSTESEFDAFQASVRTYAQTCIDRSTPPGIVQLIGTSEVVQDWDRVRAALGYDTMHHFGIS